MENLKKQISVLMNNYTRWSRIWVIDFTDSRYLVLWQWYIFSNQIIRDITFEFAELLETKIDNLDKMLDKEWVKTIIQKCISEWTKVTKEDFNQYTVDWDTTFITWYKYWISTSALLELLKLTKSSIIQLYIYKESTLVITDSQDNILVLTSMYPLPNTMF